MKEFMMRALWAIALAFTVSGCMSDNPQSGTRSSQASQSASTASIRNVSQAVRALEAEVSMGNSNRLATLQIYPQGSARTVSQDLGRLMSGASLYATFNHDLEVSLSDSPASQFFKENNLPVYLIVNPMYFYDQVYEGNRRPLQKQGNFFFNRSERCLGYGVVLRPENNYRYTRRGTGDYQVRTEARVQVLGMANTDRWTMQNMSGAVGIRAISDKLIDLRSHPTRQDGTYMRFTYYPCVAPGQEALWR